MQRPCDRRQQECQGMKGFQSGVRRSRKSDIVDEVGELCRDKIIQKLESHIE